MLIKCPECGAAISDAATACPHCGYPIAGTNKKLEVVTESTVQPEPMPEQKISVRSDKPPIGCALAAAILATLYVLFAIMFFSGNGLVSFNSPTDIVSNIFSMSAEINMRLSIIGVALIWAGVVVRKRILVLISAIIFSFACAFFILTALYMALPIVLAYVGAHKMKANQSKM